MFRWPFVSRRVHELELAQLHVQLDSARDEIRAAAARENYWRTRGERLIDNGLARANAIDGPTMVERSEKKPTAAQSLIAGMAVTEIPRDAAEKRAS